MVTFPSFAFLALFNLNQTYFSRLIFHYFPIRLIHSLFSQNNFILWTDCLCSHHSFHPKQVFKSHVEEGLLAKCIRNHWPLSKKHAYTYIYFFLIVVIFQITKHEFIIWLPKYIKIEISGMKKFIGHFI